MLFDPQDPGIEFKGAALENVERAQLGERESVIGDHEVTGRIVGTILRTGKIPANSANLGEIRSAVGMPTFGIHEVDFAVFRKEIQLKCH